VADADGGDGGILCKAWARWDIMYARKKASPEPSATPGTEETRIFVQKDGISYIRFRSNDTAGNMEETANKTIKIDTVSPVIQFITPTPASGYRIPHWIPANVSAYDLHSGINNITIYLYNTTGLVLNYTSTSSPFYVNFTALPENIYYLNASTADLIGNTDDTETRTFHIKHIVLPVAADRRNVIPEEIITVTGNATLFPDNSSVASTTIHIYLDDELKYNTTSQLLTTGSGQTLSTNATGKFRYSLPAPLRAGAHTLNITITDVNGIYAENQTSFNVTRVSVRNQNATFTKSGSSYVDVDYLASSPNLTISATIYKNMDNQIDHAWVNITDPADTLHGPYFLVNSTQKSETGLWSVLLNVTQEFDNMPGNYTVTFYANSTLANNSVITQEMPARTALFYVQNITVSVDLDKYS
ncbi:hypothetical protein, partial [Candidatus Magnetobacterium casense]